MFALGVCVHVCMCAGYCATLPGHCKGLLLNLVEEEQRRWWNSNMHGKTHTRRHTLLALTVLHHWTSCSSSADWTPLSDSRYSSLPSCVLPRVLSICLSDTLRLFVCVFFFVRVCVYYQRCHLPLHSQSSSSSQI